MIHFIGGYFNNFCLLNRFDLLYTTGVLYLIVFFLIASYFTEVPT